MISIIDPKGQQVADLLAFTVDGPKLDWLSTSHTRNITERLFPQVGQSFYSAKAEPLLTLIEDASPGLHDMLYPACDWVLYDHAGLPGPSQLPGQPHRRSGARECVYRLCA